MAAVPLRWADVVTLRAERLIRSWREPEPVNLTGLSERIAKEVGSRLRLARLARGMTQAQVADIIHSHRPVVARTERGQHCTELHATVLHALAVGLTLRDIGDCVDDALRPRRQKASES